MTRVIVGVNSGVSKDDQIARNDVQRTSTVQIVSHSTVGTIDRWLEFASDVASVLGDTARVGIGSSNAQPWSIGSAVMVASGYFWISNAPSDTGGLTVFGDNQLNNQRFARLGQDFRPKLYDGRQNLKASALSLVSTTTYTGVAFCWDWANYATVHLRIYVNTGAGWVQEVHADSGMSPDNFFDIASGSSPQFAMWGETLPSGVHRGAKWRGIHLALSYSTTAFDAPHLTDWPIYMVAGCVAPDADGIWDEWSGAASTHAIGSGLRWSDVDELASPGSHPGNDGDTSLIGIGAAGQRQSVKSSAANPLSGITSPTIHAVRLGQVHRFSGSGKVGANPLLVLGGVTVPTTDFETEWPIAGTAYSGGESANMPRPGGGSFVVGDFAPNTMEWGGRAFTLIEASGLTVAGRYTQLPGPWAIYSTESLPTGEPGETGQATPAQTPGGKRPLFRPQYDHITGWRQGLGPLRDVRRAGERIERGVRNHGRSGSRMVAR